MRGSGSGLGRSSFPRLKHPGGFLESPQGVCTAQRWPRVCLGRDNSEPPAEKPGEVFSPRGTSWQPGELQLIHHLSSAELRRHQLQHASPGSSLARLAGMKGCSCLSFQIAFHPLHPATPWFQTHSEARPAASHYLLKSSTEVHCSWLQ